MNTLDFLNENKNVLYSEIRKILFTKYHIGFKTGEFGVTRKPFNFPLKNKNKKR
jgi:ribosomal protein S19